MVLSVAVPGSLYSGVLVDCVLAVTDSQSCTLTKLPLLAQEVSHPSVDDILSRTVVSHSWMSTRFRQFLESVPVDLQALFKAVTAIVITADIRPSYYDPITGAIYIDPQDLWLTNSEKDTVSKAPDFRSDFGNDLNFVSLARYVIGTDYAWDYFPLDGNETRTINDILPPLALVFFHELAHANDAFPPSVIINLNAAMTVKEATDALAAASVSAQLAAARPLNSQMWRDLARVMYDGLPATGSQRFLTAAQVGLEFENDGASDDYAYLSIYEDPAMLFVEVMMWHHFGINREIAYTDTPLAGWEEYCDGYTLRWGFRNRVSDFRVRDRAEMALQLILGQMDVSSYIDNLPTAKRLASGTDWCTIQYLGEPSKNIIVNAHLPTGISGQTRQRLRPDDRYRWR